MAKSSHVGWAACHLRCDSAANRCHHGRAVQTKGWLVHEKSRRHTHFMVSGCLLLLGSELSYSSNTLPQVETVVPWGRPRSSLACTRQGRLPALGPGCPCVSAPGRHAAPSVCSAHRLPPALTTVHKGTSKPGDSASQVFPLCRVSDGEPAPGLMGTEAGAAVVEASGRSG